MENTKIKTSLDAYLNDRCAVEVDTQFREMLDKIQKFEKGIECPDDMNAAFSLLLDIKEILQNRRVVYLVANKGVEPLPFG